MSSDGSSASSSDEGDSLPKTPFNITVKSGKPEALKFPDEEHDAIVQQAQLAGAAKGPVSLTVEYYEFPSDDEEGAKKEDRKLKSKELCKLDAKNKSADIEYIAAGFNEPKFTVKGSGDVKVTGFFIPAEAMEGDEEEEDEEEASDE